MPQGINRVRTEEVDWQGIFPWVRLFRSFRMAIHPPKLLLALLLVVLFYLSGRVLDLVWGAQIRPDEVKQYANNSAEDFSRWLRLQQTDPDALTDKSALGTILTVVSDNPADVDDILGKPDRIDLTRAKIGEYYDRQLQKALDAAGSAKTQPERDAADARFKELRTERTRLLASLKSLQPEGIFAVALHFTVDAFERGVGGAATLNFGLGDLVSPATSERNSVASSIHDLFVILPGWLYRTHFWFMVVYFLLGLALWSLIGGAITRMAALQATRGDPGPATDALLYSGSRFFWFFITPLFPLLLSLALGLVLMLGGLLFFNLSFLDIAGGLGFIVALVCGFVIAFTLLLTAGGAHLFYPALAVEGTDAFDAVGRCFGYLIGRPWRWLFYTLVSMVYFAVTYTFVGGVLLLSLSVTHAFIRAAVFTQAEPGVNRFDAILPPPRLGQLVYQVDWSMLPLPGKAAAALVLVWVFLMVGLLAAYAVSFYCSVHTWIYLLLRRSSDGTLLEDVFMPPAKPDASPSPEAAPAKVDSPPAGVSQEGVTEESAD